jgi:RimJ/RimL family protein N-acetyltransferase
LGVRKVCCGVLDFNMPGIDVHKRFGFLEEGRLRQHVVNDGQAVDVVCLGLLRGEWEAGKDQVEERLRSKGIL